MGKIILLAFVLIGCQNSVDKAEKHFKSGKLDSAKIIIDSIDVNNKEYPKELALAVSNAISLKEDSILYKNGIELYNKNKYREALDYLVYIKNPNNFVNLDLKIKYIDSLRLANLGIVRTNDAAVDTITPRRNAIKTINVGTAILDVFKSLGKAHYLVPAKDLSKNLEFKVDFDRYYWINPGCNPIIVDINIYSRTVVGKDEGRAICNEEWTVTTPNKKFKL